MLKNRYLNRVKGLLAVVILLSLLYPASSKSENLSEETGNPRTGQTLFIQKGCMRCHSIWESTPKKGPNLASVGMGRNLYDLCASIWTHWPRMRAAMEPGNEAPIVLNSAEIRDIIAYLYFLNYYKEPGDEAKGRKIFRDRGCDQCHAMDPGFAEGKLGPAVFQMTEVEGPIGLAVALWNHGGRMFQRISEKQLSWPQFRDEEIADLVSYIREGRENAQGIERQLPGNPLLGKKLFASRSCVVCHELKAGGSRVGPDLAAIGVAESASSVVASLWNHYPAMVQTMAANRIARTKMTMADMEDLMAYVYWLRAFGLRGDPGKGQVLYETKQCATCHSKTPKGPMAPYLMGNESTKSPFLMLAAIWNHGSKMQSFLQERKIEWPTLTGDEMRHLVAYFHQDDSQTKKTVN